MKRTLRTAVTQLLRKQGAGIISVMYDIIVVGGGLNGTAIARDAALRGLSVALFEKEDFAAGASGRECRFLPGRLSALQTLDFTRVREDLHEREILLQIAPHLTRPQPCLLPFYSHGLPGLFAQTRLRASLALVDALGLDGSLPLHQVLSPSEALAREPGLRAEGLAGAALVWEVLVPHLERLALEMALDARSHGAALHTHTRIDRLRWSPEPHGRARATGVCWMDRLTGETGETGASLIIAAAGAWLPSIDAPLAEHQGGQSLKRVFFQGPPLPGADHVLAFLREDEGTLLFVVPWQGGSWVGSEEAAFAGDCDTVHATGAEVQSLARSAREFLPGLDWDAPAQAQASAIAPLPPADFPLPPLPYHIHDYGVSGGTQGGVLSVSGGSPTSCRSIAEEVVDLACRKLGRSLATPPCRTASTPLPGAAVPQAPAPGGEAALRAMVERAVTAEECRTLRDFIERRSLLFWNEDQGQSAVPLILETMTALLGWDRERQEREVKAWEADAALTQAFRVM